MSSDVIPLTARTGGSDRNLWICRQSSYRRPMVSLRIRNLFSSWPIVILAISGGLLPGCSTALSTLQTAETVPKGHWQATGGMDVAIPVTRVIDAVDAAIDLEEKLRDDPGYEPTEAEL